jgi:hypothetical protein
MRASPFLRVGSNKRKEDRDCRDPPCVCCGVLIGSSLPVLNLVVVIVVQAAATCCAGRALDRA